MHRFKNRGKLNKVYKKQESFEFEEDLPKKSKQETEPKQVIGAFKKS